MKLLFLFAFLLNHSFDVGGLLKGCYRRPPLGLRNGIIRSNQLKSSTQFMHGSRLEFTAQQARLDGPSAWCTPPSLVSNEWIQLTLDRTTNVSGIAIQGNGNDTLSLITRFKIEYSANMPRNFTSYKSFIGLSNPSTKYYWFEDVIELRHLRFVIENVISNDPYSMQGCIRFELYGCTEDADYLTPLGMETGMIKNHQLTSLVNNSGTEFARLFNQQNGLFSSIDSPLQLIINLKRPYAISGFSMQGGRLLKYSNLFVNVLEVHVYNDTNEVPAFVGKFNNSWKIGLQTKFFKFSKVWIGQYFQFSKALEDTKSAILKVELYGEDAKYSHSLRNGIFGKEILSSFGDIHTNGSNCVDVDTPVNITFNHTVLISGIIFQGDMLSNNWVKNITLYYVDQMEKRDEQIVINGCKSRVDPLAVYWPPKHIITKQLTFVMTDCMGSCCFRMDLKGVDQVLSKPRSLKLLNHRGKDIFITWKKPLISHLSFKNYQVVLAANKSYNLDFNVTFSVDVHTNQYMYHPNYGAASLSVTVIAVVSQYLTSQITRTFLLQPNRPYPPKIVSSEWKEQFSDGYTFNVYKVNDTHGPISIYEVYISQVGSLVDKDVVVVITDESNTTKDYQLAAVLIPENITNGFTFNFTNGQENVTGIDIPIKAYGEYHFCVRAVILGKDIMQYGFRNKNYYGKFSCEKLNRTSLQALDSIVANFQGLPVVAIPFLDEIAYYQVIVSSFINDSLPQLSSVLQSYNPVLPNSPYIAGVIDHDIAAQLPYFVIGDGQNFSLNTNHSVRVRRQTLLVYHNAPLQENQTYITAVRGFFKNGNSISSPWSSPFNSAMVPTSSPTTTTTSTQENTDDEDDDDDTNTIIGIVVSVIVIIIILAVVFAYFIKRKRKNKGASPSSVKKNLTDDKTNNDFNIEMKPVADTSNTGRSYIPVKKEALSLASLEKRACAEHIQLSKSSHSVEAFPKYYLDQKVDVYLDLVRQFQSVPFCKKVSQKAAGNLPENKVKNRYTNIIPYEQTRVVLKCYKDGQSDYINASYINGVYFKNTFIAAQGPKNETIADFWRMIFFEKTPLVIMLTNLMENGKSKCGKYWPDVEGDYDDFHVVVEKTSIFADFVQRKMHVTLHNSTHTFDHFHFKSWPDHGCPEFPTTLLDFCYRLRQIVSFDDSRTLLVHCSAGVGRTGTLILVDAMLESIKRGDHIDLYEYFRKIRQDRMQMVQTPEQYLFAYHAVYEHLVCGYNAITPDQFMKNFESVSEDQSIFGEFERIVGVTPILIESHVVNALLPMNVKKNFDPTILPRDTDRVIISEDDEGSNYINAVFLNGHRNENTFIATQTPLENTIKDFWLMVWSHKISTIVYIMTKDELETFPEVVSMDSELECRDVLVSCVLKEENDDYTLKEITLVTSTTNNTVSMYCVMNWDDKSVPEDPQKVVELVETVIKSQQNYGNGCILVVCSDGGNRSGTFIASMNIIDQLKIESSIDIFQTVRRLKTIRPEFVENEIQYKFLYHVARSYLDGFKGYSNFTMN